MDLMVHDLDLIRCLTGADLLNVSASGEFERVAAELFLSTGTLAALSARRSEKSSERRMTLVYDDGVIEFDFIRRTLTNTTAAEISSAFDAGAAPLSVRDPLAYGAELFANGVRNGKTLGVNGEEAVKTIDWARKIEEAAGLDVALDIDLRGRVRI
jgi:predicted dehydrogenase